MLVLSSSLFSFVKLIYRHWCFWSERWVKHFVISKCAFNLPILLQVINENVAVKDAGGKEIESQLLPLLKASVGIRDYYSKAYLSMASNVTPKYWLAFTASLPPLGFNTYIISSSSSTAKRAGKHASCCIWHVHQEKKNYLVIFSGTLTWNVFFILSTLWLQLLLQANYMTQKRVKTIQLK